LRELAMAVRNASDPREESEMTTNGLRALFEIEFGKKIGIRTAAATDNGKPT
jgi:hypothetical protein